MAYPSAFVLHSDCALHDTGWGHPEHQGRLPAVVRAIEREMPVLLPVLLQQEAEPVSEEDLLRVHERALVDAVREAANAARPGEPVQLDADTLVSPASWSAALAAAGCAVTAAALVADGAASTAFAASRPPGHHATPNRAMGFCLFNNVAVAARWVQRRRGAGRVLIVDWDVHHGNGTQDIFYEDPSVYFLSLHLSPHYPGTGAVGERGRGKGLGTTRNVPLGHGTTREEYHAAFDSALEATLEEFRPEFVFISAGFDCLAGDPLGGLPLEPVDLHRMTRRIIEWTADSAEGRVIAVLEGGYVPVRLGHGVVSVLHALAGLEAQD
ncbi:MAG TPA: histone deacetylase [Longimicrobiales bacterium]|nr:histone deacetylase [Longimicrobiales bacterium]